MGRRRPRHAGTRPYPRAGKAVLLLHAARRARPGPVRRGPREDLYAAIDLVAKKIEQQIRKRHNKTKARKHKDASRTKQSLKERGL